MELCPYRSRRLRAATLAAAALLAVATPALALDLNGFLPARGSGSLAFSATREGYDEFFVGETKVSDPGVGEVDITSIAVWLQWGITDDFALVVNLPYVSADSDGLGGFEESGLQDLTVLGKYRFAAIDNGSARHSFLGALGARTPLSDYEANLPVDIGDGTTDALARLLYQFETGRFYFSQQVGFDLRGDDAPDGFPLYTELGLTRGRVTVSGFYSNYIADGGTDIGDPGFTFPSNQEEFQRGGAKLYARIGDRLGFSLVGFTTFDGRNTGDLSGISAGINVEY